MISAPSASADPLGLPGGTETVTTATVSASGHKFNRAGFWL